MSNPLHHNPHFKRELDLWRDEGIISPEVHQKLAERYQLLGTTEDNTPWYLRTGFILKAVALFFIFTALVLFISANWAYMGAPVQTVVALLPLLASYWFAWRAIRADKPLELDLALFFAAMLFGANLFLQAQIYHISSHWPNGVLWWAIGAMPGVVLCRSQLQNIVVQVLFFAWQMSAFSDPFPYFGYVMLAGSLVLLWRYGGKWAVLTGVVNFWLFALRLEALITNGGSRFDEDIFPYLTFVVGGLFFMVSLLPVARQRIGAELAQRIAHLHFFGLGAMLYFLTFSESGDVYYTGGISLIGLLSLVAGVVVTLRVKPGIESWIALAIALPIFLAVVVLSSYHHITQQVQASDSAAFDSAAKAEGYARYYAFLVFNLLFVGVALFRIWYGRRHFVKYHFMMGVFMLIVYMVTKFFMISGDFITGSFLFALGGAALWGLNSYWNRALKSQHPDQSGK